jgi:hypothetical protein
MDFRKSELSITYSVPVIETIIYLEEELLGN